MQSASLTGIEHRYLLLVVFEKTVGYVLSRIQNNKAAGQGDIEQTECVCMSVYPTPMAIGGASDL